MTDRGRDTRDVFGGRLVEGLKDMKAFTLDRKRYDLTSGKTRVRNNSVVFPPCSVCGGRTISTTDLRKYWTMSADTIWKWVHKSKNPVPHQDAKYTNNPIANREGTHGITQMAFCIDRVNIWALQNGKKPAESWPEVLNADGTIVKLPPKPQYDHSRRISSATPPNIGDSNECFS